MSDDIIMLDLVLAIVPTCIGTLFLAGLFLLQYRSYIKDEPGETTRAPRLTWTEQRLQWRSQIDPYTGITDIERERNQRAQAAKYGGDWQQWDGIVGSHG